MTTQNIDKVLSLAAKLLAVQENRGASEAEASIAAEHLQRLLQDHNLSLSQIEQHAENGAATTSKRVKDNIRVFVSRSQQWRAKLIEGVARNNFCLARIHRINGAEQMLIIGRDVNVTVTKMTYDYLVDAFIRAAGDHGYPLWNKATRRDFIYFMDGAVTRVAERLDERRREREAEDAMKSQAASGNGSHKELVLSDVYGSEADLNNDFLNGFPAGTTATKRREAANRMAVQTAEHDRLVAAGVDSTVAWYRAYGYSEEASVTYAAQHKRQSRRRGGRGNHRAQGFSRRDEAENRKVNSTSYKIGRETGASVGLDDQVGGGSPRRIG